jgi:hypothetical protein
MDIDAAAGHAGIFDGDIADCLTIFTVDQHPALCFAALIVFLIPWTPQQNKQNVAWHKWPITRNQFDK